MTMIISFLFVFSIVVVIHELGHFWAARAFGIRVDRFSLGIGPVIASVRDRLGTEWSISAIPLGGYVKFFGDASAASNPDPAQLAELRNRIDTEQGAGAADECFHFKPVWQRAIVIAAGPIANFILALVIFISAVAIMGDSGYPPVVGTVSPGSPAAEAGFEPGDRVVAIDGRPVRYFRDLNQHAALSAGNHTVFTVERDGRRLDLDMTIGRQVMTDPFGGESEGGFIGVSLGLPPLLAPPAEGSPAEKAGLEAGDYILAVDGRPIEYFAEVQEIVAERGSGPIRFLVDRGGDRIELTPTIETNDEGRPVVGLRADASDVLIVERFGPVGAITRGAQWTWEAGAAPVRYIARTLTGRESGRELGGILRIMKVADSMATQAYDSAGLLSAVLTLVTLAGALSVSIGLLNLLPIPVLDGGHLLYYAYEAAVGRPLGEGAQEWGFRIGLLLVLGLTIFATWNDLRYLRVF